MIMGDTINNIQANAGNQSPKVTTSFQSEKSNFEWNLINFNVFEMKQTMMFQSGDYVVRRDPEFVMRFKLYITYCPECVTGSYYSIVFKLVDRRKRFDSTNYPLKLCSMLTIYNAQSNRRVKNIQSKSNTIHIKTNSSNATYPEPTILETWIHQRSIPPNAYIVLKCQFRYVGYLNTCGSIKNTEHIRMNKFVNDFSKLFSAHKFSDVKIVILNRTFYAHKVVLSARSTVFKAMFAHNMTENETGIVNLSDVDPKVFQEMLRYIYTGKVENIPEIAVELYVIADKYDLEELKLECENAMPENLRSEDVLKDLVKKRNFQHNVHRYPLPDLGEPSWNFLQDFLKMSLGYLIQDMLLKFESFIETN